jgi:hypothetical protein
MTTFCVWLPCRKETTVLRHLCADDLRVFHGYRFIEEMAAADHLVPGDWVQLAVADASSDVMLGDVGLYVDPPQQEAEVGFTLSRAAQGAGHATRVFEQQAQFKGETCTEIVFSRARGDA